MGTEKGYPDIPVSKLEHDLFDVSVYVESLADFIKDCHTPMTIAIQGDWGSGKTSMMNMVKEQLGNEVFTVWFNTWQYSQFNMSANLPISLLTFLTEQINQDQDKAKIVATLGKLLKGAGMFMMKAAVSQIGGEAAATEIDKAVEQYIDYAKEISEIKEMFEKSVKRRIDCEETTGKIINRIVIFIDDLDRLSPETAVEILEILKLFLDVENCVFVLAVDYDVVTQGIKKKFGDAVSQTKGKSFFDKIIQLPFKIPVSLYNLDKYINKTLSDLHIAADQDDIENYKGIIISSIGQNPRSIKRLFNAFHLINTVVSKRNAATVNSKDAQRVLFGILCMQMAYDDLYEYFLTNSQVFNSPSFFNVDSPEALASRLYQPGEAPGQREIQAIYIFFKQFVKAIPCRSQDAFSEDEIDLLVSLLRFSAITSHSHIVSESDQNMVWRKSCRCVAKELIILCNEASDINFRLYQSNNTHMAECLIEIEFQQIYSNYGIEITIEHDEYIVDISLRNNKKVDRKLFVEAAESLLASLCPQKDESDTTRIFYYFQKHESLGITINQNVSAVDIAKRCYELATDSLQMVLNYSKPV